MESPAPQPVDPSTGQHRAYWVLSEAERAKGFVRPLRRSYQHVGERPTHPLRDLTDAERATFTELNDAYVEKFGFPFIIAVKDNTKASILDAFHRRIENDRETEFAEACRQVERIAELRLKEKLG